MAEPAACPPEVGLDEGCRIPRPGQLEGRPVDEYHRGPDVGLDHRSREPLEIGGDGEFRAVDAFGFAARRDPQHQDDGVADARDPDGVPELRLGHRTGHGIVARNVGEVVLPRQPRPERLENGVDTPRVDPRATHALEPRMLGRGSDERDASRRRQREKSVVGEEDRARSCGPPGQIVVDAAVGVPGLRRRFAVDPERQRDDALRRRPHVRLRKSPPGNSAQDAVIPGVRAARHLQIETRLEGGDAIEDRQPVGDDQAVESPLLAQDVVDEMTGFAGVLTVEQVVRRHHRPGPALLHHRLESGQVDLPEGALVDHRLEPHPRGLLVVRREVLHRRSDPLRLHAAHQGGRRLACQVGVLGEVLEGPAAAGVTFDVQARTEEDADSFGSRLRAHRGADLLEERLVPGGAEAGARREARGRDGLADADMVGVGGLLPHPVGSVGEGDAGSARHLVGRPRRGAGEELDALGERQVRDDALCRHLQWLGGRMVIVAERHD